MNVLELFAKITTFVFDVDGVLTDGTVLVLDNGLQARRMNIKDGFALQLAVKKGYNVKIISGGNSPQVADRLLKLGIEDITMSVLNKKALLEEYMLAKGLKKEEILYMGDDLPDVAVMGRIGLPACPFDAVLEAKEAAVYISPSKGGNACVRDVIEKVMRVRGDWGIEDSIASQ